MTSTTLDALKNLYVARGGNASDVADLTVIPDVINALAAFISDGGAAELPTVTASNNGQVLTVVSGAWAAADLPTPETPTTDEEITG